MEANIEIEFLKEGQQDAVSKVYQIAGEKQQLQAKLSTTEMSRDDIHRRLVESEGRSMQLKDEKKAKTMEIRQYRTSGETVMEEDSERQRRSLSKTITNEIHDGQIGSH